MLGSSAVTITDEVKEVFPDSGTKVRALRVTMETKRNLRLNAEGAPLAMGANLRDDVAKAAALLKEDGKPQGLLLNVSDAAKTVTDDANKWLLVELLPDDAKPAEKMPWGALESSMSDQLGKHSFRTCCISHKSELTVDHVVNEGKALVTG